MKNISHIFIILKNFVNIKTSNVYENKSCYIFLCRFKKFFTLYYILMVLNKTKQF